jgi:hypothetical protein
MICPSCQNEQNVTENSYGALYTCQSCQAVYFINFEGQPEFGEVESSPIESAIPFEMASPEQSTDQASENFNALDSLSIQPLDIQQDISNVDQSENNFAGQFSDVAKDISDYGNTETQIAHLNYDLKITGLDNFEMLTLLKEVVEDSRFGWDVNEIMKSVKQGEIKFEKLNPVKAYILAKRLKFLDVEKVWTQNAV